MSKLFHDIAALYIRDVDQKKDFLYIVRNRCQNGKLVNSIYREVVCVTLQNICQNWSHPTLERSTFSLICV